MILVVGMYPPGCGVQSVGLGELVGVLPGKLIAGLGSLGYRSLNYVQVKSLEASQFSQNILIVAPTGSGKTEAAILPILRDLIGEGGEPISALYISPLRALNRDIYGRMISLFRLLGFEAEIRHGDTPQSARRRIAENPPHLLITTPETTQFILVDGRYREKLRNLRWVVVDEVHELLDDKRGAQLSLALERLRLLAPNVRVIGLSATLSNPSTALRLLSGRRPGTVIEWQEKKPYEVLVEDLREEGDLEEGLRRVAELCRGGGVIVFTNTRDTAELIGRVLSHNYGLNVRVHHGSLSRSEREEAEKLFKEGKIHAVIATSSLELGIDIGYARLVVQFGSPRQAIKLVQRVGRAGHTLRETSRGVIVPLFLEDAVESAVLARRGLSGNLEEQQPHGKPLDVLSHQIAGLLLEYRELSVEKLYDVVTRAFPYENLEFRELVELLAFMHSIGTAKFLDGRVLMGRRTISYYYSSASMIPETFSFDVVEMASRRVIGALDYSFASVIGKGKVIILGGKAWNVEDVDVDANKVYVTENVQEFGEPPIWAGMSLPVDKKASREVASLYRRVGEDLDSPGRLEKLRAFYNLPRGVFERLVELIGREVGILGVVPSERNAVVELVRSRGKTLVVVHSYLGTKGNNLLAFLLAEAFRGYTGSSAKYFSDPYRVLLVSEEYVSASKLREIIVEGLKWKLQFLDEAIRESNSYLVEFTHVASKMGVIDVKRSKPEPGVLSNVRRRLVGTPVDRETIRAAIFEHFDLPAVEEFLRQVESGERPLIVRELSDLSPLAQLIFEKPAVRAGVVASEIPASSIIQAIIKRVENSHVLLYCINCGRWWQTIKVSEYEAFSKCPRCGSRALAVLRPYEEEKVRILEKWRRKERLTAEERKFVEKARQTASLVLSYGYPAVFVLAGHGVGPTTARNILSRGVDIEVLARNVLQAEANYTRTRKYWEE
jgi:ATP-dependent Lhr-like helicase